MNKTSFNLVSAYIQSHGHNYVPPIAAIWQSKRKAPYFYGADVDLHFHNYSFRANNLSKYATSFTTKPPLCDL